MSYLPSLIVIIIIKIVMITLCRRTLQVCHPYHQFRWRDVLTRFFIVKLSIDFVDNVPVPSVNLIKRTKSKTCVSLTTFVRNRVTVVDHFMTYLQTTILLTQNISKVVRKVGGSKKTHFFCNSSCVWHDLTSKGISY